MSARCPVCPKADVTCRKQVEISLLPDDVRVVLQLDGLAERERHRRRAQAQMAR